MKFVGIYKNNFWLACALLVLALVIPGAHTGFGGQTSVAAPDNWVRVVTVNDDFETAVTFLKSSIEEEGLTISDEGDVADMMSRTQDVFDGVELVYAKAMIYQFCSAKLGYKLFALSPKAIGSCPLSVFAYQQKGNDGVVTIGYRRPPRVAEPEVAKVFDEIAAVLERIVKRASE